MNQCFVQLCGPFTANVDIISILKSKYSFVKIIKLGIQTKTSNRCRINDREIEIGKTGIYELSDVEIESFTFLQNEKESTIVDFIVE